MNPSLSVLVVGTKNESGTVLSFLKQEKIPTLFHELEGDYCFDVLTPTAYCGGYQAYGTQDIIERVPIYYHLTKK